jgi:hypothetical protein
MKEQNLGNFIRKINRVVGYVVGEKNSLATGVINEKG